MPTFVSILLKFLQEIAMKGLILFDWHKPISPRIGRYEPENGTSGEFLLVRAKTWLFSAENELYRLHTRSRTKRGYSCGIVECTDTELEVGDWHWQPSPTNPNRLEIVCVLENGKSIERTCRATSN